ncbi:MAG: hypothetical protein IJ054_02310 [Lachnospiraceae bacterium]|nr:hypothetical protein [Lachnospiraceae bacterium]MBQ9609381.1 hypothetical protein [Lachnospiraceae bacterium]
MPEEEQKAREDSFLELYFAINSNHMKGIIRQKESSKEKPSSFFTSMTKIVMRNIGISLKRFGLSNARRYRAKLAN